jgi:hypothetical protein
MLCSSPSQKALLIVCPEQLNAARGRLRTVLHSKLFKEAGKILSEATCECKEYSVYHYLCELRYIDVWPLEDALRTSSIQDVLDRMKSFDQERLERRLKSSFKIPELKADLANLHSAYTTVKLESEENLKCAKTLAQVLKDNGIERR